MKQIQHSLFRRHATQFIKYFLILNFIQFLFMIALILYPFLQNMFVYVNWLSLTFGYPLEPPSDFGPFRACHEVTEYGPLKLKTTDGLELGAWHIASNETSRSAISHNNPFLLYFHGNAGTRALKYRTETYKSLFNAFPLSELLVIDYRGFGDSEGTPSEQGLLQDALTAWNYVTTSLKGIIKFILKISEIIIFSSS